MRTLAFSTALVFTLLFAPGPTAAAITIVPAVPEADHPFSITIDDIYNPNCPPLWQTVAGTLTIDVYLNCPGPANPIVPIEQPVAIDLDGLPSGTYAVRYRRYPSDQPPSEGLVLNGTLTVADETEPLTLVPPVPIAGQAFAVEVFGLPGCGPVQVISLPRPDNVLPIYIETGCVCPAHVAAPLSVTVPLVHRYLQAGRYEVEVYNRCQGSSEDHELFAERPFLVTHPGGVVDLTFEPPHPTEHDEVTLGVAVPCNDASSQFQLRGVDGTLVHLDHFRTPAPDVPCDPPVDPFRVLEIPIGGLPAVRHAVLSEETQSHGLSLLGSLEVAPGDADRLLLRDGRFELRADWTTFVSTGDARARPLGGSQDAGAFWFFRPENAELLVKVLDGCANNGHFWVFAAGLTNVGVALTVTDTWTGTERTYTHSLGSPFLPMQDILAFDTCDATQE